MCLDYEVPYVTPFVCDDMSNYTLNYTFMWLSFYPVNLKTSRQGTLDKRNIGNEITPTSDYP